MFSTKSITSLENDKIKRISFPEGNSPEDMSSQSPTDGLAGRPIDISKESRDTEAPAGIDMDLRVNIVVGMAILMGCLIIAFTVYGMVKADQGLLDNIFELVRWEFFFLMAWISGRGFTMVFKRLNLRGDG